MPFSKKDWSQALEKLIKNIEPSVLEVISELTRLDREGELFRKIFQYYVANADIILPISVPFNVKSCNTISAKIGDFDDRELVDITTVPIVQIVDEKDPFYMPVTFQKNITSLMLNIGHYPFLEDPDLFYEFFLKAREILRQQVS